MNSIVVDSNQNYIQPSFVITSLLKNVDGSVYRSLSNAHNDNWTAGTKELCLTENGVGWSLDEHNMGLITGEMVYRTTKAREDIMSGKIIIENTWSE